MPDNTEQIQAMQQQIDDLKKTVDSLLSHNHLGVDGSLEFQGETNFKGRSITIAGGITQNGRIYLPIAVTDGTDQEWLKPQGGQRLVASGLAVVNEKGSAAEQVNHMIAASKPGKAFSSDPTIPPDQIDWDDSAQAVLRMILQPQGVVNISGPSILPPLSFVVAERTPTVQAQTGSITQGGSTVTDSDANFVPDQLVGSIVTIEGVGGSVLESYIVVTNTANVITCGNFNSVGGVTIASFNLPTGGYGYSVRTPTLLGEAGMPFSRLYVGEDIRLAYGSSGGAQVRYIKWGFGSPEGIVTANIGSMYLRFDGGANTCLYIKESGNQLPTGWVAK